MAEIPTYFAQRSTILRHQHGALYHPFIESLALTLVDVAITFIILIVFSIVFYFLVGLQHSAVSTPRLWLV